MAQRISVDHMGAEFTKMGSSGGFSTGKASCEANDGWHDKPAMS
jgi:hypothetical protein